jgi:hypothetical protein
MSDLSLLWTILSIIVSVFASVAGAAWWLKGQLTSAELAGLREQNAAITAWRGFAEAQAKHLTEQLAEAKSTNATLQKQIAEGAKKEVLADTAASSSRAIVAAEGTLAEGLGLYHLIEQDRERQRAVEAQHAGQTRRKRRLMPWETFRLPATEPTNKNIGLTAPSGDLPPSKGGLLP